MQNIVQRIDNLSENKRQLLLALAKNKKQKTELIPPESDSMHELVIEEDRFFSLGKGVFPKKSDVKNLYNSVTAQLNNSFGQHSVFLNWGYVPNDNPHFSQITLPDMCLNKNPKRLVLEVIADCLINPKDVILDVACGRGGTLSVFHQFFQVGAMYGLDLSPDAIQFCQQTHAYENTIFQCGDSENLPYPDQSMNVVTNLESSHCYPNIHLFYQGVYRVLKTSGHFLYTDILPVEYITYCETLLEKQGFKQLNKRDITNNVLLSCDDIANNYSKAYIEGNNENVLTNFLAMPGSRIYNEMKSGQQRYIIYKLQK